MTRSIIAFLVALAVSFTISCGPSAREKTLRTSLLTVNAAKDGFLTWDQDRKTRIVQDAESYEGGVAALNEHIEKREKVLLSFEVAYRAIATVAVSKDEDLSLLFANLRALWTALEDLTGKKFP